MSNPFSALLQSRQAWIQGQADLKEGDERRKEAQVVPRGNKNKQVTSYDLIKDRASTDRIFSPFRIPRSLRPGRDSDTQT